MVEPTTASRDQPHAGFEAARRFWRVVARHRLPQSPPRRARRDEPMMTEFGGDLFLLYWDAQTGSSTAMNASAGPAQSDNRFSEKKARCRCRRLGIHSVTVPGAVEGWANQSSAALAGCPWKDLFGPAITMRARLSVPELIHDFWVGGQDR